MIVHKLVCGTLYSGYYTTQFGVLAKGREHGRFCNVSI